MKLLIPVCELDNYKSRNKIPLKCEICHKTFYRSKNEIQWSLKCSYKKCLRVCSKKCRSILRNTCVPALCKTCNKSIKRKGYSKKTRTYEILGCSFEDFKLYLESKFESWMTWEIHGKYNGEFNYGWDIDHIIPIDSALNEEDLIKLNHYSNLQPLCSKINRDIKVNNIIYEI